MQIIIRQIDKDRNGYVTTSELDDILKEVYPELKTRDLMPLIKQYTSTQNPILVDYKRFNSNVADYIDAVNLSKNAD